MASSVSRRAARKLRDLLEIECASHEVWVEILKLTDVTHSIFPILLKLPSCMTFHLWEDRHQPLLESKRKRNKVSVVQAGIYGRSRGSSGRIAAMAAAVSVEE